MQLLQNNDQIFDGFPLNLAFTVQSCLPLGTKAVATLNDYTFSNDSYYLFLKSIYAMKSTFMRQILIFGKQTQQSTFL